jgi:hypothetical protein
MVASPSILKTPSEDCWTKLAASPNVNLFVLFKVSPVPSVCVSVVSVSAPKPRTALSDFKVISSLTIKSSSTVRSTAAKCAKASTTAAPEPAPSK